MSTGYDFATFETTDPGITTDALDDYGLAPGRPVVERLLAVMRLPPLAKVSGITEHEAYGWAFDVHYDGARIWCMLQRSDAWLLITVIRPSMVDRLRGLDFTGQHREVGGLLDAALRSTGIVEDLRWYSRPEFLARGR